MKIKFLPQNLVVEGTPDKTLLKIATENQLEIRSICKGVPSCAECRVRIIEGDMNVLPPSKAELSLIGSSYFIDGRRLSCQVRCFGDVTIDLSEQVDRTENQTKKIRGFRSNRQIESKAVNDTMLLNEKVDTRGDDRPDDAPDTRRSQNKRRGQGQARSESRRQGKSNRERPPDQRSTTKNDPKGKN